MTASVNTKGVELARDVILQLVSGKTRAFHGAFFAAGVHSKNCNGVSYEVVASERCDVCAVGSLVVAAARRGVPMTIPMMGRKWEIHRVVASYFSLTSVQQMERCFEGRGVLGRLWHAHYETSDERLAAVMMSAIDQGGTFRWLRTPPRVSRVRLVLAGKGPEHYYRQPDAFPQDFAARVETELPAAAAKPQGVGAMA